jgi:1-deoxy-D-xylulose-5-phosphate reductoisomerase
MNKGFEVIEAHFLFGFTYDEIDVLIQPEGIIHAMAETIDGTVFSHAASPDMRLPIQVAFLWPERIRAPGGKRINWSEVGSLTFEPPDVETFKCLSLAFEAGRRADTYPAVLNAANEVAVAAFLENKIGFLQIPSIVESVLETHDSTEASLEGVLAADEWGRSRAASMIGATS